MAAQGIAAPHLAPPPGSAGGSARCRTEEAKLLAEVSHEESVAAADARAADALEAAALEADALEAPSGRGPGGESA